MGQAPSPDWVLDLKPYQPGKPVEELERELGLRDIVKLASNENPLGPSPRAVEAMRAAVGEVHRYPDGSSHVLRHRLAQHLRVDPGIVIVGNGSNEVITQLARAFTRNGDNIVISQYGFIAYRLVARAAGVDVREVPVDAEFRCDTAAMAAACDERTRLLFLANPNNPTGTHSTRQELLRLLRDTPPDVIVVLDEAYFEYVDTDQVVDGLELRAERPNLVVMRTFSKIYGLAGMRVGYAVVPDYVADRTHRVREPFDVNHAGQRGAAAALDDNEFVALAARTNREVRETLYADLDRLGLSYVRSQTNFVLVASPAGGVELYQRLLHQGVIVRPLVPYRLPDHVRITVGTAAENARLVEALSAVL